MQNLPVILAVFAAAAAVIIVLFWRIKPQPVADTGAADRRVAEEAERTRSLQAKLDAGEATLREALTAASTAKAKAEAADARTGVAEANAGQAKSDLAGLQRKYQEAEPLIATATEQRKAAEDARADVAQRLVQLEADHKARQASAALVSERATKAEKDAAAAKAEAEAVRQRAEASDTQWSDATAKLDAALVDLSGAKSLAAEAAARRAAAEADKADLSQRLAVLTRDNEALRSDYNDASERAATAKADVEHMRPQIDGMSRTIEALELNLTEERAKLNQSLAKQQAEGATSDQFKVISQTVLRDVVAEAKREVTELAAALQKSSGDELDRHAEKVAQTLEPLQNKLQAYDEAIQGFQTRSLESDVSLKEQLGRLQETERSLHDQARALTTALSSTPKYKGTYGELALERLMEHAGLQEGPHYEKQARRNTEEGLKIPDMVVKMPGNQKVIIDAKAVMDAYVVAQQTEDDLERAALLKKHCHNVRSRVLDLSGKNYFADHSDAVELVVLFLPAENLYVAAVENDHGLADFALSRNVIICGPSLLIMLLKSASQLWRRASIEEEAQKIKECGDSIYSAACLFIERYAMLGAKIERLEEAYNEAAGTLNGNLIPKGRSMGRFAAVTSSKEVEEVAELRRGIRPFSSPEAKKILPASTEKLPGLSLGEFETAVLSFATGDDQESQSA